DSDQATSVTGRDLHDIVGNGSVTVRFDQKCPSLEPADGNSNRGLAHHTPIKSRFKVARPAARNRALPGDDIGPHRAELRSA
ncbi:hypothetical protein, partial [Enterobacter hormaechei]|uniref:hypothetical protein n=1 Tax=Enterobacter hormaechei TaxID=158836 RepID=UPI0019541D79